MAPAAELVRFVLHTTGEEATVRFGPRLPGRGAWLCAATLSECAALAVRRKAFDRAFRTPVPPGAIEDAVREAADSVRPPQENARG